jgi:hypothetical protein
MRSILRRVPRAGTATLALMAVLACAHRPPEPAPAQTSCLSATALAEARRQIGDKIQDPTIKKLDPALRGLLRGIAGAEDAECIPEEVDIVIGFQGDPADLERVGVTYLRANKHPDGSFIGTGRIKTTQLLALVAIDHLIAVDGGGHYTPEQN